MSETTTNVVELTVADLVARLRVIVRREAAADSLPDPASPSTSLATNKARHERLQAQFRAAAMKLEGIADDDYRGLADWCRAHSDLLANCCGRVGGSGVAARKVGMAIHGGPRYSLVNGVDSTSFRECYERLI